MSRTYKHAPYYVKAWRARKTKAAEIYHALGCEHSTRVGWAGKLNIEQRKCNIDEYDPRLRHEYSNKYTSEQCGWDLVWPYPFTSNVGYSGVRQSYRDEHNGKQRAAVRVASRKAVQEYNGSGDTEIEHVEGRTRSSVRWDME